MANDDGDFLTFDNDIISDDSDFYGDEPCQQNMIIRGDDNSKQLITNYPTYADRTPARIQRKRDADAEPATKDLSNPYRDLVYGRQLSETVDEFLNRIPPSSTKFSDVNSAEIWIANPHTNHSVLDRDTAGLIKQGQKLLDDFKRELERLEGEGKSKSVIGKVMKKKRDELPKKVQDVARATNVVIGKWMLFPSVDEVDAVWNKVTHGTVERKLGIAAKVATDEVGRNSNSRLVCIYTRNFADTEDVRRVLQGLRNLGLVKTGDGRGIYYKCDAYTHLGIEGGNEWGLKASMYSSTDMLKDHRVSVKPKSESQAKAKTKNKEEPWNF